MTTRTIIFDHHHRGGRVPGDEITLDAEEAAGLVRSKRAHYSGDQPAKTAPSKKKTPKRGGKARATTGASGATGIATTSGAGGGAAATAVEVTEPSDGGANDPGA